MQQRERFAQIVAHRLRIAADRIGVGRGEQLRRHLVRTVSRISSSLPSRQAGRGELGALEIAGDALVLAEEDLLVHLLEIEREVEGAAHARVLELVAADVEGESLHDAEIADREFFHHHALVAHGREIVGGRPVLGAVLGAPVDLIALEGLERDSESRKYS